MRRGSTGWMLPFGLAAVYLAVSLLLAASGAKRSDESHRSLGWAAAGGDKGHSHYSPLNQINKSNVGSLRVAWVYRSGDVLLNKSKFWGGSTIECNPIIVGRTMYVTTPTLRLVALDAASGREIWRFDPHKGAEGGGKNRGVAYWRSGSDERIFFTAGTFLYAVDAKSGRSLESFGTKGRVLLGTGSREGGGGVNAPGMPVIYRDLVIVGERSSSLPGNVSAYNVRSGEQAWVFHNIPHPGEFGYDSYGDKEYYRNGGGVNAWSGLALDEENGLVFFSTGSAVNQFYRPHNEGSHLFGNSVVALDAATGQRAWHFQVLPRDLWDLDLASPPLLASFKRRGKEVLGLIQFSKTGNTYLFDRLTGELLSDIEKRPVPASAAPGEKAHPWQLQVRNPEPFSRQFTVTEDELSDISPEAHAYALKEFRRRDSGWFMPPTEKGLLYYGVHGGAEWGGGAFDPESSVVYINGNDVPWVVRVAPASQVAGADHAGYAAYQRNGCATCHGPGREGVGALPGLQGLRDKYSAREVTAIIQNGKGTMPAFSAIAEDDLQLLVFFLLDEAAGRPENSSRSKQEKHVVAEFDKFVDAEGYPATKPPWGTLNAIGTNTGKIIWKVTLGEHEALTKRGVPPTGTENFGGPIVTKGGLVFIGATRDEKFHAFDKDTGELLWEAKLPYGGYATPSTYQVDGKQYVVIPCGGGGKLGTTPGDAFVAFALPE